MGKYIVKYRKLILLIAGLLIIPAIIGFLNTKVNYDMLNYLPSEMDTMKGQEILQEKFGKGAFSMIIAENLSDHEVANVEAQIKSIDHVDTVLSLGTLVNSGLPANILPDSIYQTFKKGHESLIAVFFDTSTSAEETLTAVSKIRHLMYNLHVSGMSAFVVDLKEVSNSEQFQYIIIAVSLALITMLLLLDNWLTPFIFLGSIAIMVLINLGTNIIFGEISYVTKALSAVLQLAVTMDYSIFLWHSYREYLRQNRDRDQAMELAIKATMSSVLGSSATTIAGFIALCFMTFTMGLDLGLVMAKGVLLGVVGSVTVLPAIILTFDKILRRLDHRPLLPDFTKLSRKIIQIFPALLIIFVAILPPSIYGYHQTNANVDYALGGGLSSNTPSAIANRKLSENFGLSNVHMILSSADLSESDAHAMTDAIKNVPGIKSVLNLEAFTNNLPLAMLPSSVTNVMKSEHYELTLAVSEYQTATPDMSAQIHALKDVIKSYDSSALLIGESSATEDMITLTSSDFQVVNTISIVAIFIIIAFVTRSLSLPVILIVLIETAIFINLAISYFTGKTLSFIAPICISTIQLGATVDYAILMTTRYKRERLAGKSSKDAAVVALTTSIPSIIISGAVLFAATIGVAVYSQADLISSICLLLARGAVISIIVVPLFLPPLLILADPLIIRTTLDMKKLVKRSSK